MGQLNIPSKNPGEKVSASEFNTIIQEGINDNAEKIQEIKETESTVLGEDLKVKPELLPEVNLSSGDFEEVIEGGQKIIKVIKDTVAVENSNRAITSGVVWDVIRRLTLLEEGNPNPGDTQAPTVPTNLSATKTATSISVSWTASTDNVGVQSYDLSVNGVVQSVAGTSANLTGLNPETAYTLRVRAKDAAGNVSAYTSNLVVTTDATVIEDLEPPTVPTNLQGTASHDSIVLDWGPSTDDVGVIGYDVEVNGVVQSTVNTNLTLNGLTPETGYTIAVRAKDASGKNSAYTPNLIIETEPLQELVIEKEVHLNFKGQYGSVVANFNNLEVHANNPIIINANKYNANTISAAPINLYDTLNALSGFSIEITNPFDGGGASGILPNPADSGVMVDNIYQTYWSTSNATTGGKFKIKGLNPTKFYHLGGIGNSGAATQLVLKADGKQASKSILNNHGSSANRANPWNDPSLVILNNVQPNAEGELEIEFFKGTGGITLFSALLFQQTNIAKS